jgi:predicted GNAT family N-acyltransferase
MAVLPEYRRHSVGSAMLQRLLEEAQALGHTEVALAAQLSAVTFYERFGFQPEGAIFTEAGIDHLMMRRRFDSPDPRSADTPGSTHP